jgi:hypothetical protein
MNKGTRHGLSQSSGMFDHEFRWAKLEQNSGHLGLSQDGNAHSDGFHLSAHQGP